MLITTSNTNHSLLFDYILSMQTFAIRPFGQMIWSYEWAIAEEEEEERKE